MLTHSLDELRAEIDAIDEEILQALSHRFSVITEIGMLKRQNNSQVLDTDREAKIYKRMKRLASEYGLPYGLEKQLWSIIMEYSRTQQVHEHNS